MAYGLKITIVRTKKPVSRGSINEDIKWLCSSLGLFTLRDKDSSCYRIFIELLKGSRAHRALSSDDIANMLGLSRGTVVHHINRLMDSGLVVSERSRYLLRMDNLEVLMDELERDLERAFEGIKAAAKRIDRQLGI
ncbi:winged helix-turn-helix transcriptional regulator [Candidatus Woesearchaeota archaeon]|nr:winged helix-turn-helix transcriptional regulator [Candidatus Woesearchaeota archaeon]